MKGSIQEWKDDRQTNRNPPRINYLRVSLGYVCEFQHQLVSQTTSHKRIVVEPRIIHHTGLEVCIDGSQREPHDFHGGVATQALPASRAKSPEPLLHFRKFLATAVEPTIRQPKLSLRKDGLISMQAPCECRDPSPWRNILVWPQVGLGTAGSDTGIRCRHGAAKSNRFFNYSP